MKREGCVHGMVRTFAVIPFPVNPRADGRILNKLDSPPAAGIFVKAPARPSNHSKFTGKCERSGCPDCHVYPTGKSKDKCKGTQKIRSADAALNYKVVAWRIVSDRDPGLSKFPTGSGYSASRMLEELDTDDDDESYDESYDDPDDESYDDDDVDKCDDDEVVTDNVDRDDHGVIDDDDDDVMVYDDEGWTLVVPDVLSC